MKLLLRQILFAAAAAWCLGATAATAAESTALVLLLDCGADPAPSGDNFRGRRASAVKAWLQALPPGEDSPGMAILCFSDRVAELATFTQLTGENERLELLAKFVPPQPETPVHDLRLGLYAAFQALQAQPAGRKAVILFSAGRIAVEGADAANELNRQSGNVLISDLLPQFAAAGIRVYPVIEGENPDWPLIEAIAEKTRGQVFRGDQPRWNRRLYHALFATALRPLDQPERKRTLTLTAGTGALLLLLPCDSPDENLIVTDPRENFHSSRNPLANPAGKWLAHKTAIVFYLAQPQPGDWTLETTIAAAEEILVFAGLEIKLGLKNPVLWPEEALEVTAALELNGERVREPLLLKLLEWNAGLFAEGSKELIALGALNDRGEHNDRAARDAVFSGRFADWRQQAPQPGAYTLRVQADCLAGKFESTAAVRLLPEWLQLSLSAAGGAPGDPLILQARLDPARGVRQPVLTAQLRAPDRRERAFKLSAVGENSFAEAIEGLELLGDYEIRVTLAGYWDSGAAFSRVMAPLQYRVLLTDEMIPLKSGGEKETTAAAVPPPSAPPEKSGRQTVYLVIIAVQTLLLAGAAWLLLTRKPAAAPAAQPAVAAAPAAAETETEGAHAAAAPATAEPARITAPAHKRKTVSEADITQEIKKFELLFHDDDDLNLDDLPEIPAAGTDEARKAAAAPAAPDTAAAGSREKAAADDLQASGIRRNPRFREELQSFKSELDQLTPAFTQPPESEDQPPRRGAPEAERSPHNRQAAQSSDSSPSDQSRRQPREPDASGSSQAELDLESDSRSAPSGSDA